MSEVRVVMTIHAGGLRGHVGRAARRVDALEAAGAVQLGRLR